MGRVSGFVDLGMLIKVAATVAVALVAFGSMATPARADAALSIEITAEPDPATVGELLTYTIVVTNTGDEVAEGVGLTDSVDNSSGSFDPDDFSVSTNVGSCMIQATAAAGCQFGNLAPGAQATVTVRTVPTSAETLINQAFAAANNVPDTGTSIETEVEEALEEDNGERVLINHKGKELCLPEAALKGHLKHGDEVIDEEGCSAAGANNGKHGRASGK